MGAKKTVISSQFWAIRYAKTALYLLQSTMTWGRVHLLTTPIYLGTHLTAASRIQIRIGIAQLDWIPRVLTALSWLCQWLRIYKHLM